MDENNLMPFLLVTANVGSVFEDPTRLLKIWMKEFLSHVAKLKPKFIALHLQEVGGKTYEKSMEYVQDFIQTICESNEFQEFNRIRIYLDEDYNSAEHFTALGNLYFAHKTINMLEMWDFHAHDWAPVEGISIHTGNIECVTSKEKAKFPQNFFPECRWSRKGFLRTRWNINGTVLDLVNIHLFHDASNLAACETFPSVYCKSRRRAFVHTLERFHKDPQSKVVPYFVFGDFNFRCDTEGVVRQLTEDLTMHRVQSAKNDNSKVQYRNSEGSNVLTVGKKEFTHCDQSKFKENWLRQFDKELETLKDIIYEYPVTFPPSYPYEEEPSLPHHYMKTRCPAWCDRILISKAAKKLINGNQFCDDDKLSAVTGNYGVIGENVCMGDHKPVYLSIRISANQGIENYCSCDKKHDSKENVPDNCHIPIEISCNYSSDKYAFSKCLFCYGKIQSQFESILSDLESIHSLKINHRSHNLHHHLLHESQSENCLQRTPRIKINVFDTEKNVSVCMCAVHNSEPDLINPKVIDENDDYEEDDGQNKFCPVCRCVVVRHRKGHIKRLMLSHDIIVNRFDTTHLTAQNCDHQHQPLFEPYTPESVESHSPQTENEMMVDELKPDEIDNGGSMSTMEANDLDSNPNVFDENEQGSGRKTSTISNKSNCGVSPRQLKSRLEKLQKSSFDNEVQLTSVPNIFFSDDVKTLRKTNNSRNCCQKRCCIQ